MKTELSKLSPITLLTAIALQSRSEGGAKPIPLESVIDEVVRLGQKHSLPVNLWKPIDPKLIAESLVELRALGQALYVQGRRFQSGPCAISVPAAVKQLCSAQIDATISKRSAEPMSSTDPTSRQVKRETLSQLARFLHPEIAAVLDAILADELA